jgi:hypothetical protein
MIERGQRSGVYHYPSGHSVSSATPKLGFIFHPLSGYAAQPFRLCAKHRKYGQAACGIAYREAAA